VSLTEEQIQNSIFFQYTHRGNLLIVPCSFVFGWEADIVIVTRALFTHEFEIKLTRSDFLNDKKKDKFEHFRRWLAGERVYRKKTYCGSFDLDVCQPPNYFWYVCPTDMIKGEDVPPWAGLAYVDGTRLRTQKKPKRLHTDKLPTRGLMQVCGSLNGRYWHYRLNSGLTECKGEVR
jgi:hypothetical protein